MTAVELEPFFQLRYSTFLYHCRKGNHKAPQQLFPLQIDIICSTLFVELKRNRFIMSVWHLLICDRAWWGTSCTVDLSQPSSQGETQIYSLYLQNSVKDHRVVDRLCIWSVMLTVFLFSRFPPQLLNRTPWRSNWGFLIFLIANEL